MMRRRDFKGEKEWSDACWEMRSRIVCSVGGEKMEVDWRLVISKVLDGGEGWMSGGRAERSICILGDIGSLARVVQLYMKIWNLE